MRHDHIDDWPGIKHALELGFALLLALATLGLLTGCGTGTTAGFTTSATTTSSAASACQAGFLNQSAFTPAQLAATWQWAQTELATQPIPMNPLAGGTIQYYPEQPQALTITPNCQVTIETEPDVPTADLPPNWHAAFPKDPTGVILCPGGSDASSADGQYCEGITLGTPGNNSVVVAASIANVNAGRIDGTLGWEMQNVILERILGFVPTKNGWER
jgi:hypothetical protein